MAIYFITCGPFVKIGYASNPKQRLANLQTGNPYPLTLWHVESGMAEEERIFHERFHDARSTGEWFNLTPEIVAYVSSRRSATKKRKENRGRITKRVYLPGKGLRYCPAVLDANGQLKPDVVLVNNQEELHPEGSYYVDWTDDNGKRIRKSVGNDPLKAGIFAQNPVANHQPLAHRKYDKRFLPRKKSKAGMVELADTAALEAAA